MESNGIEWDRMRSNEIGSHRIEPNGIESNRIGWYTIFNETPPQTIVIQPKSRMGVAKGDHLNLDELPSAI